MAEVRVLKLFPRSLSQSLKNIHLGVGVFFSPGVVVGVGAFLSPGVGVGVLKLLSMESELES